jgi:gliding motility-associated-like protein
VFTVDGCSDIITITVTVIGLTDPSITPVGPYCTSDPVVTVAAVDPGGTWTATCGACINGVTGDFDPSSAGVGIHTITYTIGGSCGAVGTTTIDVQNVVITNVAATDPLCALLCDGTITITATGATEYSADNGANWQPGGAFAGLCEGTYDLMARNALGCSDAQQVILTDPLPLALTFSSQDAICFGACDGSALAVPAGGTQPYVFVWSSGPTSSPGNATDLCAANYNLAITDNNGCTVDTLQWVINEPPPFVINVVTTTPELCIGDCLGTIDIDAPGAVLYSVDNGLTFVPTNVFNNQCAGNHNIVVQNAAGCSANGTTVINAPPPVNFSTTLDTIICIGGTAQIGATATGGVGGFVYTWDNALPSQANHGVTPAGQTVYMVSAIDVNGCPTLTLPVVVDLFPPLTVIALSDQAICFGFDAQISAIAQGGNGGPYTYTWDQTLGNDQAHNVSPTVTTVYTVVAADNCETPDDQASVTITVNPLPVPEFEADRLEGCLPVVSNFTNLTAPGMVGNTCLWDWGDGSPVEDNCAVPQHIYGTSGCYDVTLTMMSPENCIGSVTFPSYICAYDYPDAAFTFGPQPTTILQPEIEFTNWSTTPAPDFITDYAWTFAELGTSIEENPIFEFPSFDAGIYDVCLTVTNNHLCTDTECEQVIVDGEMFIYVPNAFSPNGDGVNDVFLAEGLGLDKTSKFELMVFNRWGERIFKTDDPTYPWDGRRNGVKSQTDVYVWKIIVTNPYSNEKKDYLGHVTLLR